MIQRLIQSSKAFINGVPKGILAFAAISVCCLVAAVLLVMSVRNTSQADMKPGDTSLGASGSNHEQGTDTVGGNVAGASTNAQSSQPASGTNNLASNNTPTSNSATNGARGNTSTPTAQRQPSTPAAPSRPATSRADYNLNETWYFATAGTAGIYNTCWPTELNESNEAQCADLNSVYTETLFFGIGISKSAQTAQEIAANQAHQKALAQHVDPRRGGGSEDTVLNEALCSQYSLSCGRW